MLIISLWLFKKNSCCVFTVLVVGYHVILQFMRYSTMSATPLLGAEEELGCMVTGFG